MNQALGIHYGALYAQEEIRRLALRYARSMDMTDAIQLRKLWTNTREAVLPWIDLGVIESTIIPSWTTRGRSQMRVLSHEIEVHQETARGIVTADVLIELSGQAIYQSVRYFDDYQQDNTGRWRFFRRYHELVYGYRLDESPWVQRQANWPAHQTGSGGPSVDAQAFLDSGQIHFHQNK